MRRMLAVGLGCSLAWLAAVATAEEHGGLLYALKKRAAATQPAAPAPLAPPVHAAAPGIVLGRPQALPDPTEPRPLFIAADTGIELASRHPASPGVLPVSFSAPVPVAAGDVRLAHPPTGTSDFASGTPGFTELGSGFAVDAAYAPPRRIIHPVAATVMAGQPVPAPTVAPPVVVGPAAAAPMMVNGDGFDGETLDTDGGAPAMSRFYVRSEYLLWWIRSPQFPVLVTTGPVPPPGTPTAILGQPGTRVLFGGNTVDYGAFSGGRITLGYWFDPCQQFGIEGSYFFLAQRSINFAANSNQFPVLARPFFQINNGMENAQLTTLPGFATGSVAVNAPGRLWGADLNLRCNCCCDCSSRWTWLAGVRALALDESVTITEDVLVSAPIGTFVPGDHVIVYDNFGTQNRFFGAQVGLDWERRWGNWQLDVRMKLALGNNQETINITGAQLVTHPNGTQQAFAGGLLALPSNIGHFERNRISVVPEVGINLGYHVTDSLLLYVGYNGLFWSNVVRPADQIDRVLDRNQIPNLNIPPVAPAPQRRPLVPFKETTFWRRD